MTKLSQKSHENVSPASYDRLKYTGKAWNGGVAMKEEKCVHFIKRAAGGIVFAVGSLFLGILLVLLGILYGIISMVIGLMDYLLRRIERNCKSREETEKRVEPNEIENKILPV